MKKLTLSMPLIGSLVAGPAFGDEPLCEGDPEFCGESVEEEEPAADFAEPEPAPSVDAPPPKRSYRARMPLPGWGEMTDPEEDAPHPLGLRVGALATGLALQAVGIGAVIAGTVINDNLDRTLRCDHERCFSGYGENGELAYIFWGVGSAMVLASVVLIPIGFTGERPEDADVEVSLGVGGVVLGGRF